MKIAEKADKLSDIIAAEKQASGDGSSDTGDEVQRLAVAAILGGRGSAAWETYMKKIVEIDKPGGIDRPDQLLRLKLDPSDLKHDDPDMKKAAAYIVANGTCGATTTTKTMRLLTDVETAIVDADMPA